MKGKSTFTQSEARAIIALIRNKILADGDEQKKIRNKIRALGFYATDFGIGGGYNEQDFLRAVKIIGDVKSRTAEPYNSITRAVVAIESPIARKRPERDETYIINLCDEVIKLTARRQHRFDFLRGDAGTTLPLDAYYASLKLVIEYREKQHTEEVKFFDKRKTVSGINRGLQRKKYDQLRRDLLPEHGLTLIEFGYEEFGHSKNKRLLRNREDDIAVIQRKLKIYR